MLSFFKKRKKFRDMLQNWRIPIDTSFERIENGDSVQFVNADESRILYFSILTITNNHLFTAGIFEKAEPAITHTEHGWQLKGAIERGNEVIVCVFSFTKEADTSWMKNLFESIEYNVH